MANQTIDRKEAVTMRKFGFTYKQIAERLGCSQQWCATHLANIKVDESYLDIAYSQFKEQTSTNCEMCGMYIVTDEDSEYFSCVEDSRTGDKFCSNRCLGHRLLDDECLKRMHGDDYKML